MGLTFNMGGGVPKGILTVTITSGTATSVVATMNGKSVSLTYSSSLLVWSAQLQIGTWTVTATDGSHSKSGNATITAGQIETLSLALPRLPSGYVELEYIEGKSNDSSYINTGYKPVGSELIGGKFALLNATSATQQDIWFVSSSGPYMYFSVSGSRYWMYYNTRTNSTLYRVRWTAPDTNIHTYSSDYTGITFDGVKQVPSATREVISNTYNLVLYFSGSSSAYAKIRHYYLTIGNAVNMIPAKRTSNNKLGMYDIVRNSFYAVTGTANAGPEV